MGENGKVSYTVRMPEIIYEALKSDAKYSFVSVNSIICQILADYYEKQVAEWRAQIAASETSPATTA